MTTNRLIHETSPYLLQHAHNPVDWYPWGDEALDRARRENKPIFLSIGYSACHWCHVMERESFEDEEVARILNQHFVSIKVDREERPDLDEIYMTAVQMMTGGGGWPMSVFLTPDRKPFFAGTYFPRAGAHGRVGFVDLLAGLAEVWETRRGDALQSAEDITRAVREITETRGGCGAGLSDDLSASAVRELRRSFDPQWGGFGGAPKFPPVAAIQLLLREHAQAGEEGSLAMVTRTLDAMGRGGFRDQIGGGFHRYSVDEQWLVPHFEKMLYDNALLAMAYSEAFTATRNPHYREIAHDTLQYVLRDMTDSGGGFYSSEDADSEGQEGIFYTWTTNELRSVLGETDAELAIRYYNATEEGNFEGRNILHVPRAAEAFARMENLSVEELGRRVAAIRTRLLETRSNRARPRRDEKVLASWNGLMISAMSRASVACRQTAFRVAAEKAADFVLTNLYRDGVLHHSFAGGRASHPGFLDDYAFVGSGLVDLYEATFDIRWLRMARGLADSMLARFGDSRHPLLCSADPGRTDLIARTKPTHDGAEPSGNAMAAILLLRLSRLLGRPEYQQRAREMLESLADDMREHPRAHLVFLAAAKMLLRPCVEVAVIGFEDREDTAALLCELRRAYIPNSVTVFADPAWSHGAEAAELVPLLRDRGMVNGRATAYVCEDSVCKQPATTAAELARELKTPDPSDCR